MNNHLEGAHAFTDFEDAVKYIAKYDSSEFKRYTPGHTHTHFMGRSDKYEVFLAYLDWVWYK